MALFLAFTSVVAAPWVLRRLVYGHWRVMSHRRLMSRLVAQEQISPAQASAVELARGRCGRRVTKRFVWRFARALMRLTRLMKSLCRITARWQRRSAWCALLLSVRLCRRVCGRSSAQHFRWLANRVTTSGSSTRACATRQLDFTLYYPPYLNRVSEKLLGSDGELEVPEGTEIELTVTPALADKPEAAAVWSMACVWFWTWVIKANSRDDSWRRSGQYRFALTVDGEEVVERRGHSLTVYPDHPPKVTRRFPDEPLELETATEVEFLVEAQDDHGVAGAELITRMEGSADEVRHPIRTQATRCEYSSPRRIGSSAVRYASGRHLKRVVEMSDNNSVTGPGKGRSRWHPYSSFRSESPFGRVTRKPGSVC